eukprot:GHVH01011032.1.p1 GENE.GHVH01011032.1~~GHVH01011032.1.p1  ORF type:complete len:402 (-),score=62.49 GHVH01011032.1:31-1116(-)
MNCHANEVYFTNFGDKPDNADVVRMTAKDLDGFDVLLLSPPCQPFSQKGTSAMHCSDTVTSDWEDCRNNALKHVIDLIPRLCSPPQCVFLENVRGFQTSVTYKALRAALIQKGYQVKGYLLSPTQFGIPNTRVRFYMIAHLMPTSPEAPEVKRVKRSVSEVISSIPDDILDKLQLNANAFRNQNAAALAQVKKAILPIGHFVDPSLNNSLEVGGPRWIKITPSYLFDAPYPGSVACGTFTSSYGHLIGRSGPLIDLDEFAGASPDVEVTAYDNNAHVQDTKQISPERFRTLDKSKRTRWFAPEEIQSLMLFPDEYSFPTTFNNKSKWKLLGNSVNVGVITSVLLIMLNDRDSCELANPLLK